MQDTPSPAALPRDFQRVGWATLAAQGSEQIALAAAPLAAVLVLGAGAAETGMLQAAQTLPFLLLSLPVGLAVDRASRRRLMVGSELLRALSLAAILLLLVAGGLSLPMMAALGFLGAIGTVCFSVAAPAMVPMLVPREQLTRANRWLELARSGAFVAGPAIGGAVVGWTGAPATFALATALSLLAALWLARVDEPPIEPRPRRHPLHELAEGARFVSTHPLLRPILVTAVLFNFSWFVLQAVFVAYALERLGVDAAGVGIILAVYGVGMVLGAASVNRLARRLSFGRMIALGPFCGMAAALLVLGTVWLPSAALAAAGFFLFGAGPIVWTITTISLRQVTTPNGMLGRVSALITTATFGARPLGAGIAALVAGSIGVEACLALAFTGFVAQFLVIALSRVPRLRHLPEAA